MFNHRDRAAFVVDEHVKAVLEFMQENVPTSKLIGICDAVPQMARLLWGNVPQEPLCALSLTLLKPAIADQDRQSLPASI